MGSIKKKTIKGIIWTATGTLGSGVVSLIITMILARMINPAEFGLIEIVLAITLVSGAFIDAGFSEAVIRDKDASQCDLSSVFYFNISMSVLIYLALFFSAPIIADLYNSESIILLSRVLFLKIIFDALTMIQMANCVRLLNFKPLAKASLLAMLFTGILSIITAFKGFGIWALVVNTVGFSIFKSIILFIDVRWTPSSEFSIASIKRYSKFGGGLLAFSIIDKAVTNLESLLIGKVYSQNDLGYFSQARKFDSLIVQTITGIIQKVTYPSLVQINDSKSLLLEGYRKVIGISMFFLVPIACFLYAIPESFMETVYGAPWILAAPYLRAFALLSMLFPIYSICINIFKVKGYSFKLLKLSVIHQSIRILVIILLLRQGVLILTWGIVASMLFGVALFVYHGGKIINYHIFDMIKDLSKTFLCGIVSAGLVYVITQYCSKLNIYFLFGIQTVSMFILYWILSSLSKNKYYLEVKVIMIELIKKI